MLESLCRTCMDGDRIPLTTNDLAHKDKYLISIYHKFESKESGTLIIMDLLKETSPQLMIECDDMLPKNICETCLEKLLNIQEFRTNSLKVEQRFREMIKDFCDPLEINVIDPLNNDSATEFAFEKEFAADNNEPFTSSVKGFFTLIEKNGEIIEVYNASENCDNLIDKDSIEENICDIGQQSDVNIRKNIVKDCHYLNMKNKEHNEKAYDKFGINITTNDTIKITRKTNKNVQRPEAISDQSDERMAMDQLTSPAGRDLKETTENECIENHILKCDRNNIDSEGDRESTPHQFESSSCTGLKKQCNMNKVVTVKLSKHGFRCDKCGRLLKSLQSLRIHFQRHNKREQKKTITENGHICPVCGLCLKTRVTFRRHIIVHEKDETKIKYKCQYCNKVFSQAGSLRHHARTHTGERPYLCSTCGKAFANQWTLKDHTIRHGTELNYQCPKCPKKFRSSSSRSAHKAIVHTTVRPHVCDLCGASFKKPDGLKKHKVIHGEKKHKCDFCEKKFAQVDQCRRHMRTHTGEKPYKCKYCERAFIQSNDMMKHLRIHVGENVYRCELCPLAFRLLCELRTHFTSHKDDDEQTKINNLEALKREEMRIQAKIKSSENINV